MFTADKNFLLQLTALIDKQIQESSLSSETLATEFCLSPRHFNRKVNAVTGMNCTLYIRKRRIERACAMLRSTELPMSEIYVTCGIESASYFSRLFKSEMGMTPTEYRRSHQE